MNQNTKEPWEEKLQEVPYMACGCYDPECKNRTYNIEDLIKFTRQTLLSQRNELVGEIVEIINKLDVDKPRRKEEEDAWEIKREWLFEMKHALVPAIEDLINKKPA